MPRKRAPNGNGTIYKRKDGRFEGKVSLPPDPITGETKRKAIYGKTEDEVAKKIRQLSVAVDTGAYQESTKITVKEWLLDVWLPEYCGHLKETTYGLYERHAKNIIVPALGGLKLAKLTAPGVQKFINSLQSREKPLAPKSIKNVHGVLHASLKQAVAVGYIRANPSDACKLPRVERPKIKPIVDDDLNRFLDAIQGHENEREFIVCLFAGLRQGELLGLTWDCIDFDKGTIYLYRQLQFVKPKGGGPGVYKFMQLKNDKTRTVSVAWFVMDTLKEQRRAQAEWRLRAGELWNDGNYVFTDQIGEHIKRNTIYHRYKRVVASIGLPDARFHDTRHTYAINSIRSGVDIKTLQESLGHHTASFTLDVYGHASEQMRQEAADKMDAFYVGLNRHK